MCFAAHGASPVLATFCQKLWQKFMLDSFYIYMLSHAADMAHTLCIKMQSTLIINEQDRS